MKSSNNPVDIITRFNHYSLKENSLWLKDSGFLYLWEFPYTEEISINENDGSVYLEKLCGDFSDVISKYYYEVTSSNVSLVSKLFCITHYSKFNKLLRVTSYIMRFINNLKRKVKCEDLILNNYFLPEKMKQSLFMWLKENQSLIWVKVI